MIKVYSQCGEEQYITDILGEIGVTNKFLVDLGAGDGFHLSNTQYFLEQGWTGIRMDGNNHGNQEVKQEWITRENICDLLKKYDCPKEFDLLSIDLDSNDYWILQELLKQYSPRLIVAEINGAIPFGEVKIMKYDAKKVWECNDYYGFSISAGIKLAEQNGYKVVFQNDALNIYMVRRDCLKNPDDPVNLNFQINRGHPHSPNREWVIE